MKLSRLKTLWLTFISFATTGIFLIKVIVGRHDRAQMNTLLNNWADAMLNYAGIHYEVVNPLQITPKQSRPTILMVNHTSAYDIPLSFKIFPEHAIRMLAKSELSHIPLMGPAIRKSECLFVHRKNRYKAMQDLEKVKDKMQDGIMMWIAPEGTRTTDGKLGIFKKGGFITAIQTGAEIIPVGIRGAYDILPRKSKNLYYGKTATLHIGQPIDASEYTMDTRDDLIQKVHTSLEYLTGELT